MNKYSRLLPSIATKYNIPKGKNETETEWKVRIIYSICGMMAYTSLWDDSSDENISITHMKHRITDICDSYKYMYPETKNYLPYASDMLEEEITQLFLDTGIIYHRPNRISPARKSEACYGNISFQRGINIQNIEFLSGLGFYSINKKESAELCVEEMFGLDELDLEQRWKFILSQATWKSEKEFESNTEYLKMETPFTKGYWINRPYKNGDVSILRTGMKGSQLYYLYRYNQNNLELSALPLWQVEKSQYRSLSNACLQQKNVLPSIEYNIDGSLIHFHINYLLPPKELSFIKLYSWPEKLTFLPSDFNRKCSAEVFSAIKGILTKQGYRFIKR